MGVLSGLGRMIKPLVNVPKWMNTKQISKDASYIGQTAKDLFKVKHAQRQESFTEARERLQLTDQQLRQRYQEFRRLMLIFLVLGVGLAIYALWHWLAFNFFAGLLSTVVTGIALVQAFRFHFWMYQIKQQKLGCTFKAYFYAAILGRKV